MKEHQYEVQVTWTGNKGDGTSSYTAYARDFNVEAPGKAALAGSADPAFRGDPQRWNPEDMLVASLSACHKLWYLHLCAVNGVNVWSTSTNHWGAWWRAIHRRRVASLKCYCART